MASSSEGCCCGVYTGAVRGVLSIMSVMVVAAITRQAARASRVFEDETYKMSWDMNIGANTAIATRATRLSQARKSSVWEN